MTITPGGCRHFAITGESRMMVLGRSAPICRIQPVPTRSENRFLSSAVILYAKRGRTLDVQRPIP